MKCNENSSIIQNFCHDIREAIKNMAWRKKVQKIGEGLAILENIPFGLRYAYDKLIDNNKKIALSKLINFLQDKVNGRKKDVLSKLDEYLKNLLVSKLFPFRKYFMDKILRLKLIQWRDIAFELQRLEENEKNRINRIVELLKMLIDRYDDDKMAVLR